MGDVFSSDKSESTDFERPVYRAHRGEAADSTSLVPPGYGALHLFSVSSSPENSEADCKTASTHTQVWIPDGRGRTMGGAVLVEHASPVCDQGPDS